MPQDEECHNRCSMIEFLAPPLQNIETVYKNTYWNSLLWGQSSLDCMTGMYSKVNTIRTIFEVSIFSFKYLISSNTWSLVFSSLSHVILSFMQWYILWYVCSVGGMTPWSFFPNSWIMYSLNYSTSVRKSTALWSSVSFFIFHMNLKFKPKIT